MQPDNNLPIQQPSIQQVTPPVEASVAPNVVPVVATAISPYGEYAGFWGRFNAIFIDGIILSIFGFVVGFVVSLVTNLVGISSAGPSLIVNGLVWLVQIAYPIYLIGSRGQTIGKMIMKIKVVNAETGEIPGFTTAFLREIVGKFVSGLVLGIGYFVAYNDPKKQSWHDKIAHTIVVKLPVQ